MNIQQSVTTCFRKYATFHGRASRSEYWWFVLILVPITVVVYIVNEIAWVIIILPLFLPYIAVSFRRLHDMGRSGWWYWMPVAVGTFGDILTWRYGATVALTNSLLTLSSLAIMVYWLVSPGDAEANRFGEPPVPVES